MSRLASLLFAGTAVLSFAGCLAGESSSVQAAHGPGHNLDMDGCIKIEGADLGTVGLLVELDGLSVEFTSWLEKDGEPGEYVGFTLSSGATFYIKAGNNADNLFEGSGTMWVNPNGTGGSAAKGISNIQICEIEPPVDEPPPPPPPEEPCGSTENPCPPPPPPPPEEPCGSTENPCPPPPPEEPCSSTEDPCPPDEEPPPPPPEEPCNTCPHPEEPPHVEPCD